MLDIKFIRENLKYFANSIVEANSGSLFKSIILLNADKLTMDAQSALRRCIEVYNHSTRFFIIVDDKYKILKPILSRFSDIYCNEKILKKNSIKKKEVTNPRGRKTETRRTEKTRCRKKKNRKRKRKNRSGKKRTRGV